MPPLVHVAAGDSIADAVRPAGLAGALIVWADSLDDGPLHADPVAHRRARAAHTRARGWIAAGELDRLAGWDADVDEALDDADELCLWFEQDLQCQLGLVHLVARAAARARRPRLSVLPVDDLVADRRALSELAPDDLADRFARRIELDDRARATARDAWAALAAATPVTLAALAARVADPAWPHLGAALRRYLTELPAPGAGLGRTEDQLVRAVATGATSIAALLAAVGRDDVCWPTDTRLAAVRADLVALIDVGGLTALGAAVLAGRADRVRDAGIDLWRGGVALRGRGPVWRCAADGSVALL